MVKTSSSSEMVELPEPILVENPYRYTLFPIQHHDLWNMEQVCESAFWIASEVKLHQDIIDWREKLNDSERHFLKNILAYFAFADGQVNENIALNFLREVQYPEARQFYQFQLMIEGIHNHVYSLLIDTYIENSDEKLKLFHAIDTIECVKKKAQWAEKYIKSPSFQERLVAFAVIEGIFFSGAFCAIFWLKERKLMPGLGFANSQISRDENFHAMFAAHVYKEHIINKLSEDRVRAIVDEALAIEKEFITESLPVSLIGMNSNLMKQHLEYTADNLLTLLGLDKVYKVKTPFIFMEKIAMENKTNFFEDSVAEYNKAGSCNTAEQNELAFDSSLLD